MTRVHIDNPLIEPAAGNGLLDRRLFLSRSAVLGGTAGAGGLAWLAGSPTRAAPLAVPEWSKVPGLPFIGYGQPSKFEAGVVRTVTNPANAPGAGAAWAPLHLLNGTITPNALHFERSHSGIPDIDPDAHRLLIHGLVKRPLIFTLEALARYPMESRITFIECGGNSLALYAKVPVDGSVQKLHGLASCAEWTGVKLSILLDEAGVDRRAQWLLAEGADSAGMSRSVPMAKAMNDAIIALYQNGERVRPSNGYPMRLLLPGYEGNMSVKWPGSPGRQRAGSPTSKSQLMAARVGHQPRCRNLCSQSHSRDSALLGHGMADRPRCRAGRPTRRAMSSPPVNT